MTEHDRLRAARALQAGWDNLDEMRDAVRALQSTDDPALVPLHDKCMKRMKELESQVRRKYVLGFAFADKDRVVLMRKKRPKDQDNCLNGVGGEVIQGETWIDAMVREFLQETGLGVVDQRWTPFCTLVGDRAEIMCYTCDLKTGEHVATTTDEEVGIYPVNELYGYHTVRHVDWLVRMARDKNVVVAKVKVP